MSFTNYATSWIDTLICHGVIVSRRLQDDLYSKFIYLSDFSKVLLLEYPQPVALEFSRKKYNIG